ncbi:MAG: hypothetical protein DMG19_16195 [Acidobacteria bacterium]|nr:MAG: hypothetical protein DMG19_16195 [Acidobacteriota bacterium]
MHSHHLGQCIDIKAILRSAVAQGCRDRDRQLLEHGIENCKPRHKLGMFRVAVADLTNRRLVNRPAQIHLQNLGMSMMLPSRRRFARS